MPCSPTLLAAGVDCGNTPRRPGGPDHSHDHLVPADVADRVADEQEARTLRQALAAALLNEDVIRRAAVGADAVDTEDTEVTLRVALAAALPALLQRLMVRPADPGQLSDGFHTFGELYEHRHAMFCALVRLAPPLTVWRTRQHEVGAAPMYEGMFLAGIALPSGDVSYHLPERCWDLLDGVREVDRAPHWDGYTPADVVNRLNAWRPDRARDPRRYTGRLPCGTCGDGFGPKDGTGPQECSVCGPAFEPDTVDGVVESLILSRDSYSQNLDVTRAQTRRFARALRTILDGTGGQCESSTSGIGSCYRDGRTEDARYTADRCCDACIAHRALTEAAA